MSRLPSPGNIGEARRSGPGRALRRIWGGGENDALVTAAPVRERYGELADFLGDPVAVEAAWKALRMAET